MLDQRRMRHVRVCGCVGQRNVGLRFLFGIYGSNHLIQSGGWFKVKYSFPQIPNNSFSQISPIKVVFVNIHNLKPFFKLYIFLHTRTFDRNTPPHPFLKKLMVSPQPPRLLYSLLFVENVFKQFSKTLVFVRPLVIIMNFWYLNQNDRFLLWIKWCFIDRYIFYLTTGSLCRLICIIKNEQ